MYDVTSEESFLALDSYLQDYIECREYADPGDFAVLLVGNKSDLSDKRAVSLERVMEWCAEKRYRKPIVYIGELPSLYLICIA